ncbi:MAG: GNAT family N-acetyltransferase [Bdellovibrionales bacterium]
MCNKKTNLDIRIAPLSINYFEPYLRLVNSEIVHKTTQPLDEFEPFSRERIKEWLNEIASKSDRVDFAILDKISDEFLGELVLNQIKGESCNIRIAILPEFHDKGVGTKAVNLGLDYAFERLDLASVTLGVYNINPRAIRVYEKCGFKETHRSIMTGGVEEIHMVCFQ